jgi:regulator of RNase E activity RraA/CMP-N-acetylneuraminic acid synthetase
MKIAAFLPAKGSSSRVENKNIRLLDGKPLFLHMLEKLAMASFIDEVYLDTESEEIIAAASEANVRIMRRSPDLATNRTDGNQLFLNEVRHCDADICIQVLGTSPFIELETIVRGLDAIRDSDEFDSALLVRRDRQYTWKNGRPEYNLEHIPNSVDLPDTIIETMGLYIVKREVALRTGRRIGDHPFLIDASPLEAVDVNWPEDFRFAELIAAGKREKDRRLLGNIRNQLTSSLLSDLLDDLGAPNQVVKGLHSTIDGAKIFGRAKTLKLRRLREGEDFKGIYEALKSYETIVPNDVILVENDVPEFAYFGELNANLAIRSGAAGVIVNGMTRDTREVKATGLPVFARGSTCQDVRKRATVESFNKTVDFSGVAVKPGCLVFADAEGVVIIPQKLEREVMEEVFRRMATEKRILVDISMGSDVADITQRYGFF